MMVLKRKALGYKYLRQIVSRIVLLFAFGFLPACFSTRKAEAPGATSDWTPPNQPEILIANFRTAVTTLSLVNYERCFIREGYRFFPDPVVGASNLGLYTAWSLQNHELEYIRNLIRVKSAGVAPNTLLFTGQRFNNITADSVEFVSDYALTLYQTDTSYRQYQFAGQMSLFLSRNAFNEWVIGGWRDVRTGAPPSWTELKGKFVSR
jgi:hypothetical protein